MMPGDAGQTPVPAAPRWALLLGALAVAAAVLAYRQVGHFGFCDLDDPSYVLQNRAVLAGFTPQGLLLAFRPDNAAYLSPLVTLSFMLDARLFGFWPGGYHLVNLAWHAANVALFFWLVLRLTGSRTAALVAGLLLAVHPVHVEAVAWITARKDMLSTFFGLAAIHIYISWARRPGVAAFAGLHAAHALGLLAKPMLATLPGLLLLLDFWPLRRLGVGDGRLLPDWRQLALRVREKLLLAAMGLAAAAVTLGTHLQNFDRLDPGPWLKLSNALASVAGYLGLLVWPARQAIVYPFPETVAGGEALLGAVLLAGLSALCLREARRRPYLAVGWMWFLCALLPVIVPPRVGMHVAMADRWAYVPFLGLYLALGCLADEAVAALRRPAWRAVLCAALLAPLAALLWAQQRQLETWATPLSIYEQALRVSRQSHVVLNNYAGLMVADGRVAEAEAAYREALALHPGYGACRYNLALLLLRTARASEALAMLDQARPELERMGNGYEWLRARAACLAALGRVAEAEALYAEAVGAWPDRAAALLEWAALAESRGLRAQALELYRRCLRLSPGNGPALAGERRLSGGAVGVAP